MADDAIAASAPRAKFASAEANFARGTLNLEHFLRRTGVHFGGKCSSPAAPRPALTGSPKFRLDLARSPRFHGGHVIGLETLHLIWDV